MNTVRKNALAIITEAKENDSKKIDFTYLDHPLDNIPDSLFDLVNIEEIFFGNIHVNEISSKILNLKKLQKIDIPLSNMKSFPLKLMELESLKEVTLKDENIISLPKVFNEWSTLNYLNLGGCKKLTSLEGLPPNLTYLHIGTTNLYNIPDIVFSLQYLNKIVLHNLNLTQIPSKLFDLSSLMALFLGENKLETIPKEILKLEKLTELVLYDNKFKKIPTVILNLKKLIVLNLSTNKIDKIPEKISNLKDLQVLDLSDNNLTEIPHQLKKLGKLKEIRFDNIRNYFLEDSKPYNKIKTIPEWITSLTDLKEVKLTNNTIENIPDEIQKEGFTAIKNFILSKQEAETEDLLCEAKMVIVGRGNVGKSVLTKKLTTPSYTLKENTTTKGIDVLKNPFIFPINIGGEYKEFKLNIWDFGGQEKYDATHQLFITNRSIYLFLTEAREESNYSDFQFWLNTIKLFSNNSPVIIILSKCDIRKKLLPESIYKQKFDNIIEFVDVSCANGFEYTIQNLKGIIQKAIYKLPQTNQKLSNRWLEIRSELENLSNLKDFITYDTYLQICDKNKLNKIQADFLSQYLNDLGVIIHHQHDLLLKKTVFINTDWCVDGMYKVLDDEIVIKNNGRFNSSNLETIWNDLRFENKQEELLKLMKEYNLCFELKDGSGFIAPDLLPPDKSTDFSLTDFPILYFEYHYDFMPSGLLSRFIVRSHSFIKNNFYWKHGVVLEYDETIGIVEEDYINGKIKIQLSGSNKKGLLSAIRMFVDEIHKDFNKTNNLFFEEMIPCNCLECSKDRIPHFYKFNMLKKYEQKNVSDVRCEKSAELVSIKSLINDVLFRKNDRLETNTDLKEFILEIIDEVLEKEILLKEGFMNFWRDSKFSEPKNEIEFQPYISNTLDNHCKTKGINLSREVKEANGSVDIIFSYTSQEQKNLKVCLELKKSHHPDITTAIKTQLPAYLKSANTESGIYLVIWFKNKQFQSPKSFVSQDDLIKAISKNNLDDKNISLKVINCSKPISPSKIR